MERLPQSNLLWHYGLGFRLVQLQSMFYQQIAHISDDPTGHAHAEYLDRLELDTDFPTRFHLAL
jgi:hypothetical protein